MMKIKNRKVGRGHKTAAGRRKAMNGRSCFVSADCECVAVRKSVKLTGSYKCIKVVFYNAKRPSRLSQLYSCFSTPNLAQFCELHHAADTHRNCHISWYFYAESSVLGQWNFSVLF
jgi:hypothetical protein